MGIGDSEHCLGHAIKRSFKESGLTLRYVDQIVHHFRGVDLILLGQRSDQDADDGLQCGSKGSRRRGIFKRGHTCTDSSGARYLNAVFDTIRPNKSAQEGTQ